MNFSDLFENIKEQIESLDKKFLLILSSLVLIIIVSLILIIVLLSNNKKNEKTEQFPLVLQEELVIPPSAELPKDYNISRKTEEKWTTEETDEWFTVPSDREVENLSKANEKIIDNILEAAPWKSLDLHHFLSQF